MIVQATPFCYITRWQIIIFLWELKWHTLYFVTLGCEYGNKATGCTLAACEVESNIPLCCATCGASPTPSALTRSSPTASSTTSATSNRVTDGKKYVGDNTGQENVDRENGAGEESNRITVQSPFNAACGLYVTIYGTVFTIETLHIFAVVFLCR